MNRVLAVGQRFDYLDETYVVTEVLPNPDEGEMPKDGYGRAVLPQTVWITARRLDILTLEAVKVNALLNAHEADQRADS